METMENNEMERSQTNNQCQLTTSRDSWKLSPTILVTDEGKEISLYHGYRTQEGLYRATAKIKKAFPAWSVDQAEMLADRFADNGFTDDRMMAAVNHVIDSYDGYGKLPNIANFIQFDKRCKIYSHGEIGGFNQPDWTDVDMVRIEGVSACKSAKGQIFWAKKSDIARYGMTVAQPKQQGQDWPD